MDYLGVPVWFIVFCAIPSLFAGVLIRRWLEGKKAREALKMKERAKEVRKELKIQKRKAKKAEKAKKNTKKDSA